jgi:hypothetical protein
MAVTVKLHETTQDNSEEHEGSEEMKRDEIGKGTNREEVNEHEQLVYGTNGGYKCETPKDNNSETNAHGDEQLELKDGECGYASAKGLNSGKTRYTSSGSMSTNPPQCPPIKPHPMRPQTNHGSSTG